MEKGEEGGFTARGVEISDVRVEDRWIGGDCEVCECYTVGGVLGTSWGFLGKGEV